VHQRFIIGGMLSRPIDQCWVAMLMTDTKRESIILHRTRRMSASVAANGPARL